MFKRAMQMVETMIGQTVVWARLMKIAQRGDGNGRDHSHSDVCLKAKGIQTTEGISLASHQNNIFNTIADTPTIKAIKPILFSLGICKALV
jgi:hypothetical protein